MAAPTLETVVVIRPGDGADPELLFEKACRDNPLGKIEQEPNGDILIMAPTGAESSDRNAELLMQLALWAKKDGRGRVFDSQALFILPDGSKKSPDASWVHRDKLLRLPREERRDFAKLVPDFVIELVSPSDRFTEAKRKMQAWRRNGVDLGWLIHADRREVLIYRRDASDETPEVLRNPDQVMGDGPVAGFVLEMAEIWKGLDF